MLSRVLHYMIPADPTWNGATVQDLTGCPLPIKIDEEKLEMVQIVML